MRSAANGSDVNRASSSRIAAGPVDPVVVELPGGEPCLVADSGAEEFAPAAEPVDRLRSFQPQPRLGLRCRQRALDELADQGAAAFVVEAAGRDALQRSVRDGRRLQNRIQDFGEPGILRCAFCDLAGKWGNGGRHGSMLPAVAID